MITTSTKWSTYDPFQDAMAYLKTDEIITNEVAKMYWEKSNLPKIKKVIFNNPATIIIWADKSKTVVKCMEGDTWDPEKGFMAAYLTKILGQKRFHSELKKYVKPQVEIETNGTINEMSIADIVKCITDAFNGKTLFDKESVVIPANRSEEKKEDK